MSPAFFVYIVFEESQIALVNEGMFFTWEFQPLNVEGKLELEEHNFVAPNEIIESNRYHQWT